MVCCTYIVHFEKTWKMEYLESVSHQQLTQILFLLYRAVRLSEDHKPHPNVCPSEISRINDAGGCVLWGRVQGCLAVSRAFGDRTLQPYVIADPYVQGRPIDPDTDAFFYLASDGVTGEVLHGPYAIFPCSLSCWIILHQQAVTHPLCTLPPHCLTLWTNLEDTSC